MTDLPKALPAGPLPGPVRALAEADFSAVAQRFSAAGFAVTQPADGILTIKAEGERTLLTLHHAQFADQAACDAHARGWSGMLDNIEKVLV